ncbi:YodC family protein [Hyphomicrobium sp. 2TAF46]|uniref:YodC family protein n=1 Tax=Hyphomicrobium sp. 2TAF46 TaxID=3233019 RepID=UPI003F9133F7
MNVGDKVRLKSGGAQMTVAAVDSQNVDCIWFDGLQHKRAFFPFATIELSPDFSVMNPDNAEYDPLEQWRS